MRNFLLMVLLAAAAACGDGENDGSTNNDHSHSNNGHSNHGHTNNDIEVDTYSQGLEKEGHMGHFTFAFVDANPAPPDKGDNTWTLRITDTASGDPIDDATVTVTPFMPQHGHGTSPADFDGAFSEDGTYEAGPFDLSMPGIWETTVTAQSGDVTDMVTFTFDVEG